MTSPAYRQSVDAETVAPEAKGPWDDVLCTLPDCTAPLYMERRTSMQLIAGMTVADLRNDEHSSSWSVTCGNGHVLLVSGDEESPRFGLCPWHDEEEHDCPRGDLDKLRKIARVGPHEHIRSQVDRDNCRDCGDPMPSGNAEASPSASPTSGGAPDA